METVPGVSRNVGRVASGRTYKSNNWVFTVNDVPQSDFDFTQGYPPVADVLDKDARWAVYQIEKAPSGHVHVQGYMVSHRQLTLTGAKKIFSTAHWEMRMGSHSDAKKYCEKEDTRIAGPFYVHPNDEPISSVSGRAAQSLKLKQLLDDGIKEVDMARDNETFGLWKNNYRVIERYKMLTQANNRDWPVFTTVYWGIPGTGKTRRAAYEAGPDAYWVSKPPEGRLWLDGYQGQANVVIDEFYGWIRYDQICRMLDRYPCMVETKGGQVSFLARKVWITSNKDPQLWYKNNLGALQRRLSGDLGTIERMDGPGVWEPPAPSSPSTDSSVSVTAVVVPPEPDLQCHESLGFVSQQFFNPELLSPSKVKELCSATSSHDDDDDDSLVVSLSPVFSERFGLPKKRRIE